MWNHYTSAWSTLRQARYGILIALIVYAISGLAGWIFADVLGFFETAASGLASTFEGKRGIDFALSLFLHNLMATYIAMCMVTLWGLFPMVNAVANGLILGWLLGTANGPSLYDAAILLVPHGIFEWPAMMTAWGVGLWRGAGYRFDAVPGTWFHRWKESNRVFLLIVLPFLMVAAIVESRAYLFQSYSG